MSTLLSKDGGYVEREGGWWIPSGKQGFGPELTAAKAHFYTPRTFKDPFGHTTNIEYDRYDLLPVKITDPLDNTITTDNNYEHMQPNRITDMNGNQTEVVQNPLGEVVGTAIRGNVGDMIGDSLDTFEWPITDAQLAAFLKNPEGAIARELLGTASTRTITRYNHFPRTAEPSFRATIARVSHTNDRASPAAPSKLYITFTYFDGLGREIQVKTQDDQGMTQDVIQEPDGHEMYFKIKADQGVTKDVTQASRWHCSGWTVWNNRGLAVRQYEPFFDTSHEFVDGKKQGCSSATYFYDYLGRPVCTFSPDGTRTKVILDSWKTTTYDASDLLRFDPRADLDVAGFYQGWELEYPDWDTWYMTQMKDETSLMYSAAVRTEPHRNTPTVTHLDSLAREISRVENNGENDGKTIFYTTRKEFDIAGNVRAVIDAKDRQIVSAIFDMNGQVLHNSTMDFGQEWIIYDVAGKIMLRFQDQDIRIRTEYDILQRPTGHFYLSDSGTELQFEKFVYGDQLGPDGLADHNARGRIYKQYDQSGVVTTQYDFKGNVVATERQLAQEYKFDIDWSSRTPPALENEKFISTTTFDALNRPTEISVDGARTRNNYNSMSLISSVETLSLLPSPTNAIPTPPPSWVPVITSTEYDAMGRKTCISYGNNTRTEFTYDTQNLRLIRARSWKVRTRPGVSPIVGIRRARSESVDKNSTQDLQYTYDPRGNITHIDDKAQPYIDGVSASKDYTYDPINRLIESSGRKDMATEGGKHAVVRYTEKYSYDSTGNILSIRCRHDDRNNPGRTKRYHYNEAMSSHKGKITNRLSEIEVGGKTECFVYDVHGNVISMAGFSIMEWDFQNQLRKTSKQVIEENKLPETTYYVYGADGNRVRKVTERKADPDQQPARLYDTLYLGGLEIFRKYLGNGLTRSLERRTTSIGSETPIRRVETQRWETSGAICDTPIFRYQLPDHLGSVGLELDNVGDVLSYEEYSAYGETTYQAPLSIPKSYRFSGKEQDTETGLYYFGARYYAASVGRWISPDLVGIGDGPNVYCNVSCNPVSFVDPDGKAGGAVGGTKKAKKKAKKQKEPNTPIEDGGGPESNDHWKWKEGLKAQDKTDFDDNKSLDMKHGWRHYPFPEMLDWAIGEKNEHNLYKFHSTRLEVKYGMIRDVGVGTPTTFGNYIPNQRSGGNKSERFIIGKEHLDNPSTVVTIMRHLFVYVPLSLQLTDLFVLNVMV